MNKESIQKAIHTAQFLRAELLDAGKSATAVEYLALLPMIQQSADLLAQIGRLQSAISEVTL